MKKMEKKNIIILLALLLVIVLIAIFAKVIRSQQESDKSEAIKILEKRVTLQVYVKHSVNNINNIKKKLENMEYVKNVELISKNDSFEDMKNKLGENIITNDLIEVLPNSFVITLDINSVEDFEKVKTLENNISELDEIRQVDSSCNEIIEVYEKTGIKGLQEYDKILTIMSEQGIDAVTTYLDEHKETRELLKDFIHF